MRWPSRRGWRTAAAVLAVLASLAAFTGLARGGAGVRGWRDRTLGPVRLHVGTGAKALAVVIAPPAQGDRLARTLAGAGYAVLQVAPAPRADSVAALARVTRTAARLGDLPATRPSVLVGRGTGAALVHAALAHEPTGVFHTAIAIDYCAPVARGATATDWYVFQGGGRGRCPPDAGARLRAMAGVHVTMLPADATDDALLREVGTLAQWLDPALQAQALHDDAVPGVPLVPVADGPARDPRLVVLLSGDGGWAALDAGVAASLARRGVRAVGWDSLAYFWQARDPQGVASDLARVLRHYSADGRRYVLAGYSFGAGVLPFVVPRLPAELRAQIDRVVLIAPPRRASFEFHLADWLAASAPGALAVASALPGLDGVPTLCLYGLRDTRDDACVGARGRTLDVIALPGDHHFDGDYDRIAGTILADPTPRP